MSRRRNAPSVQRVEQDAHDMLAGRVPIHADKLLEAIHAINPTGRSLSAADERRRYELKSRLQSLLIRRFPDDVAVSADGPGAIAIRHRYEKRDACHARLDELDDDARARVQWLLDVGDAPEPALAGGSAPVAPRSVAADSALARGRAALAEFDYEAARALFEDAALDGDPAAARELLELLVDHLALDGDALALERRLPPGTAGDADVRGLLAVAAARTGDDGAVRRLVDGLTGPRAADAWAALAEGAIRQQAYDRLEDDIARLAAVDPAHPGLVGFREAAQRLRADARRPAEQALLQLAETGGDGAVEASARALLARWPDSAVAGRLLGGIHDRQRAAEAARLVAEARTALADGSIARASELTRRARAAGADTDALLQQIRDADEAQRRVRDDAEVAAVCAQLTAEDLRPGLAGFLALDPALRARVRSQSDLAVLDWLEQAAARNRAARATALVDAVIAVAAAATALERGDDEHALAILEPHAAALAGLGAAGQIASEARRRIAARRATAAASALDEAERALGERDLERSERLCQQADVRDLDAALRPRVEPLRRELRARRDTARSIARIDDLVAAGDLLDARRAIDGVLATGALDAEPAAALRVRLDELRAELRRAWCARSDHPDARGETGDLAGELLGPIPYLESSVPWLVPGGRDLVIASTAGPHVFFGRISVESGRVLDRWYLRAPEPLDGLVATVVVGDALWLLDEAGRMLQASWRTGEPLWWRSLAEFLGTDECIERAFLIPRGSHLWLEASRPGEMSTQRVIDLEAWRVRRELADRSLHPLVAGAASCVIGSGLYGGAVRYTERGAVADEIAGCAGMQVSAVTIDPEDDLVVLGSRSKDEDGDGGTIEIAQIKGGRAVHGLTLPDSSSDMTHSCASARSAGLLAVNHWTERDHARLVVSRFGDPGLAAIYSVTSPSDLVFAQDADAREVACLWDSTRGLEIAALGSQPPAFGDAVELRARWFAPTLTGVLFCGCSTDPEDTAVIAVADRAAKRGDWAEVRRVLEGVALESVAPRWAAHHAHLLGLAWLRTGAEAARARELWQRALPLEESEDRVFTCQLDAYLDLVEPMPEPLPDAWWGPEAPLIRQLRGAMAIADRRFAEGQPGAARDVMRRRVVTAARERQSAARLAAAWLADDRDDSFDKALALALFGARLANDAIDLPVEGAWDRDRISEIADAAARWLAGWADRGARRDDGAAAGRSAVPDTDHAW